MRARGGGSEVCDMFLGGQVDLYLTSNSVMTGVRRMGGKEVARTVVTYCYIKKTKRILKQIW